MNLISSAWIPVRTRGGGRRVIRPGQIVDSPGTENEPVAPDWARGDFDVATYEFLIGLLLTAAPPSGARDWGARWREPPDVAALDAAFGAHAPAFELAGDGPRFLQDCEHFEDGAPTPIERLMVDAPGESAVRKNQDVLTHRDRYPAFDLPTAAIALYALQQFAPSGGAGNRTSMRGGGPFTALALPSERFGAGLWRAVWLNVPYGRPADPADPRVFPWMAPTRTSENDRATCPDDGNQRADAHPAQAFFGMPRRLRLTFWGAQATGFHQKPRGVRYVGWRHPVSPYYRLKDDGDILPAHPKPGRFGYRDWVAATAGDGKGLREAALSITDAKARLDPADGARLLIAGWAMNNMEAEDYLLAVQPLHLSPNQADLDALARDMAEAGEAAWKLTRSALRRALFAESATVSDDAALFEAARTAYFDRTEDAFHHQLATADPTADAPRQWWLTTLRRASLDLFGEIAGKALSDPARDGARIARAARLLHADLDGRNQKANPVHAALGLDAPGPTGRRAKEAHTA
jgi:CRISPR system Cascade subunit CasA